MELQTLQVSDIELFNPTMDSVIEVVANLLRIRGDDFHTWKN